jgi:hypothetical protein
MPTKIVSLWESVSWIAFDDFDVATPPGHSNPILENAQWQLYESLRDGDVGATGLSFGLNQTSKREVIPADFWSYNNVDWSDNTLSVQVIGYSRITLERKSVVKLWPVGFSRKARSGAPSRYNEAEFLGFCVWEAAKGQLPRNQSRFIGNMSDLIQVVWKNSPSDSWFKERVHKIYRLKERYEKGRKP